MVKQDPDTEAGLRHRSHKGLPVALRIIAPIVRLMSRVLFKEHFRGSHNIPASGPAILVANHVSVVDPL
ncbi:MAG: 1-acyl-sn-glycerol-3-phosphate acyltransferase, partial [Antricoccus sp.]